MKRTEGKKNKEGTQEERGRRDIIYEREGRTETNREQRNRNRKQKEITEEERSTENEKTGEREEEEIFFATVRNNSKTARSRRPRATPLQHHQRPPPPRQVHFLLPLFSLSSAGVCLLHAESFCMQEAGGRKLILPPLGQPDASPALQVWAGPGPDCRIFWAEIGPI